MTKKTELICIVDRSGSMQSMKDDAIGGFDAMIKNQKVIEGEMFVTLVTFDDRAETIYQALPLDHVPSLMLEPRGSTALLDAIGMTLLKQNERILKDGDADLVIVAILTDGQENASREYKIERVQELIKQAEEKKWEFIYLGANQDAFSVAQSMGFSANSQRHTRAYDSYSSASVRGTTQHLDDTVAQLRAGPKK